MPMKVSRLPLKKRWSICRIMQTFLKSYSRYGLVHDIMQLRDDLEVNVFVHHERYNKNGNLLDNHENGHKDEADDKKEDIDSEDEEEVIDLEKDEEDEDKRITNKYIVDMIAKYKEINDDLVLHWGIGKKAPFEWVGADDKFLPLESKRWPDGKAVQTKFILNKGNKDYRTLHIDFFWLEEIEPSIKSMSYVFLEQKKNRWYNNNSKDFHLKFQVEVPRTAKHLPLGKIGEVVDQII